MKLTEKIVKNLLPKDKPYKKFDSHGLFLLINPTGRKYWRVKFRFANKEKILALGVYPEVSLKEARAKHAKARILLKEGVDPSLVRKIDKKIFSQNAQLLEILGKIYQIDDLVDLIS